jgi:hypothetical protein
MAAHKVGVGIDGDRDLHDARRGPGRYDTTVANLERYLSLTEGVPNAAAAMISAVLTVAEARGEPGASVRSLAARLELHKVRLAHSPAVTSQK